MSEETLVEEIVDLVVYYTGHKKEKIKIETRLFQDIGCYGDDIFELFSEIHDKWGVDFSGFIFDRHFPTEGTEIPRLIRFIFLFPIHILSWFFIWPKKLLEKIPPHFEPITIQDLVNSAKAGRWVMEYEPKPGKD